MPPRGPAYISKTPLCRPYSLDSKELTVKCSETLGLITPERREQPRTAPFTLFLGDNNMKFRTCSKCHQPKELNDQNFCPNNRYAEGLTRICRVCNNGYRLAWTNADRLTNQAEH